MLFAFVSELDVSQYLGEDILMLSCLHQAVCDFEVFSKRGLGFFFFLVNWCLRRKPKLSIGLSTVSQTLRTVSGLALLYRN